MRRRSLLSTYQRECAHARSLRPLPVSRLLCSTGIHQSPVESSPVQFSRMLRLTKQGDTAAAHTCSVCLLSFPATRKCSGLHTRQMEWIADWVAGYNLGGSQPTAHKTQGSWRARPNKAPGSADTAPKVGPKGETRWLFFFFRSPRPQSTTMMLMVMIIIIGI